MSKELEALKEVREYLYGDVYAGVEKRLNTIETALEDYELLKERTKLDSFECLLRLEEILPRGKELLVPVAKQLKALEIIKEKGLFWSIEWQPFEKENDYRAWDNELYESKKLTKEEYNTLKEVLL
jgi:hypothetical protein